MEQIEIFFRLDIEQQWRSQVLKNGHMPDLVSGKFKWGQATPAAIVDIIAERSEAIDNLE